MPNNPMIIEMLQNSDKLRMVLIPFAQSGFIKYTEGAGRGGTIKFTITILKEPEVGPGIAFDIGREFGLATVGKSVFDPC